MKPVQSSFGGFVGGDRRHQANCRAEREDAERDVDQGQPAPAGIGRDHAPGEWRDDRRDEAGPDDEGHRPHDVGLRRLGDDAEPADWHHHRPSDALKDAHRDQLAEIDARRAHE
jgi:hypothetical protein